jgi:hypothetical protein
LAALASHPRTTVVVEHHSGAFPTATAVAMMSAARVGTQDEPGAEHDGNDEHDARDDADPGQGLGESALPARLLLRLGRGICCARLGSGDRSGRGGRAGRFRWICHVTEHASVVEVPIMNSL